MFEIFFVFLAIQKWISSVVRFHYGYYNKLACGDFFSKHLCGTSGWKRCLYHRSILSALSRLIKHSLLLGNSEIIFRQKNVPRQIIYSWVLDPVKAVAYKLHIWKEKYIFFLIRGYWVIERFSFIYTLHDFLKEEIPWSKLTESFSYSFLVVVISTRHSFLCPFLIIYRLYTYRYHTLLVAIAGTTDLFHFEDNYIQMFVLTRSGIVFRAKLKEEKLTKLCPLSFVFFTIQLGILSTDCTRSTAT